MPKQSRKEASQPATTAPAQKPGYVSGLWKYCGPRGDVWYYQFKFNGEVYRGSTDCQDQNEAKAFLTQLKAKLIQDRKRGQVPRLSFPTVSKIYFDWLEAHQQAFAPRHLKSVNSYWTLYIEPAVGHLPLDRVTTAEVEKLRAAYLASHSNGGGNSLLKILNTIFGHAIRHKILVTKPYTVSKLRVQQKPRAVLAATVVRDFLAEIDRSRNPQVPVMLRMMVGLGLREDEALTARWDWVDLKRCVYTVGKAKGKEAVPLPVPEWLAEVLEKADRKEVKEGEIPWMFPAEDGKPHRAGFTRKPVERAAKKVGLTKFTPHRLRATFATLHAEIGTPLPKIQQMLRHKDIKTTMRYVEGTDVGLREAQESVAKRLGFVAESKHGETRRVTKKGNKEKATARKTSRSRSSVG